MHLRSCCVPEYTKRMTQRLRASVTEHTQRLSQRRRTRVEKILVRLAVLSRCGGTSRMIGRVPGVPVELATNAFKVLLYPRLNQAYDSATADQCGDVRGATRPALAVLLNVPSDLTCASFSSQACEE